MDGVLYREVQRFRALWVWLLLIAVDASVVVATVAVGRFHPLVLVAGVPVVVLFALTHLTVEVHAGVLRYRFAPFQLAWREIALGDLLHHEACEYQPLREFGGWGLRGVGANRAVTVDGKKGVRLTLRDGRRLLLGSRTPHALDAALDRGTLRA